ncbi:MAG: cupin domain-containing protein [Sphaerochaeta sp.]|jgi:quercetin dioxygenase-like cupin family protein|uniref:cupin domain-containing protein n=1 Tax=Sphaerochaeta sp. TaxID=1972642 RepID=UPI002975F2EB|nr:cupin domain-containing protein [Sphaerochaeta sp.]
MLETVYSYTKSVEKIVEKLVGDDQVMINHVVLAKGEALPEHYSDSNVYLIVVQGMLTIALEEDEPNHYQSQVVNVPFHTRMNISNTHTEPLEFFIVKAPHPRVYKAQNA